MFDDKENQYQALASWLNYRLEGWRTHRDMNYVTKWDEYYRLWRGIWASSDKLRDSESSRLINPALQQAVESTVSELCNNLFSLLQILHFQEQKSYQLQYFCIR